MKSAKVVNTLALLGVLIVLLGVTSAANLALAAEAGSPVASLNIDATASN